MHSQEINIVSLDSSPESHSLWVFQKNIRQMNAWEMLIIKEDKKLTGT